MVTYLISKDSEHKLARTESLHHTHDHLLVRGLWHVTLKTDIGEIRLWRDVDRHVTTLQHAQVWDYNATLVKYEGVLLKHALDLFTFLTLQ